MNNKKSLLLVAVVLVVLIGGAYLLYDKLGAQMERPGLVVQEKPEFQAGTGQNNGAVSDTNVQQGGAGSDAGETVGATEPGKGDAGASEEPELTLAPDFKVYDADGNAFKLSDFRGKPVVLNFWASWCGPCKSEMPDFQEIYEEYGDKVHFAMVNMTDGYQETKEKALKFVTDGEYTFPVYYDTDMDAAYTYNVYSIPTTYFVDAEGYMVAYGSGAMEKEIIMTGIEMILP